MAINYNDYPPNWKTEIVPAILTRAHHACEMCGVPNKAQIHRNLNNPVPWIHSYQFGTAHKYSAQFFKVEAARVVLTVAHIYDEDPMEVDLPNLLALCQRCHLGFDQRRRRFFSHKTKQEDRE